MLPLLRGSLPQMPQSRPAVQLLHTSTNRAGAHAVLHIAASW